MSHEIRTPMNAIVGLSRLALDDGLPEPGRGHIDKVHSSAMALMGILDDVLDYSKIEAGQLRFEHLPIDIAQVVQHVVDLFAARIARKGLALSVALSPALPRRVFGDALRLSQVLNNLVGNAVKFTEHGHIELSVQPLDADAPAGDMLRFVVRDTGIGIAPAQRDALFEAFSQGDSSITRRFGGTGLGLAICRRLVAMMHGTIGVDSEPGAGSRFWFTARLERAPLPAGDAPPADAAPPAPSPFGGNLLHGMVVLVVEDNELNRLVAQSFIERMGAEVEIACDGTEALAWLAQPDRRSIDLVLMDLHMPLMDGLEATRRIRAQPALDAIPVIGMTAAAMAEDRARCIAAGMVDYVTKPIVAEQLLEVLLHWSGRRPRR